MNQASQISVICICQCYIAVLRNKSKGLWGKQEFTELLTWKISTLILFPLGSNNFSLFLKYGAEWWSLSNVEKVIDYHYIVALYPMAAALKHSC